MGHGERPCVFSEIQTRFRFTDYKHIEEMCEQLYMDRLGHWINGVAVTRRAKPRRK